MSACFLAVEIGKYAQCFSDYKVASLDAITPKIWKRRDNEHNVFNSLPAISADVRHYPVFHEWGKVFTMFVYGVAIEPDNCAVDSRFLNCALCHAAIIAENPRQIVIYPIGNCLHQHYE